MPKVGVFKTINPADISITPFKTYKLWEVDNTNYDHRYGIKYLSGIYSPTRIPISASLHPEPANADGSYQKVTYYSINHLFYKRKNNPAETFGDTDPRRIDKMLYESCSVISIPQRLYGESLKEKSIDLHTELIVSGGGISYWFVNDDFIVGGSGSYVLQIGIKDDGNGNLYDTAIYTGSVVPFQQLVGYWGFNEKFKDYNQGIISSGKIEDRSSLKHQTIFNNVKFEKGIQTTGIISQSSGHWATLDGTGYIYIKNSDEVNFKKDQDFAISLWVNLPNNQVNTGSSNFNYIVSKEGEVIEQQHNARLGGAVDVVIPFNDVKYPYAIKVYNQNTSNSGKIWVGRNDGRKESFVTSSNYLTGSQHHIVFQKTGSLLQLYVDGILDTYTNDKSSLNTHNESFVYFGSQNNQQTGLSGSIDEIRIMNRALSSDQIWSLSDNDFITGSAYNTARIGNIFYKHGILVISDPRPKYKELFTSGLEGIDYYIIEDTFVVS
jgi:hypothetical protein